MASSGGTTGTPVSGALGSGNTISPIPRTYLSLPRYARILGLNPAHFCRASAPSLSPQVFPVAQCSGVWPRYSWQNSDQISHEELAYAIQSAEQDLIELVKFFPAPTWVESEIVEYPRHYDRTVWWDGTDVRGGAKLVKARNGRVIAPGRRATSLVATATSDDSSLIYLDDDGDGFYETAQITVATSLTSISELHVYFAGTNAADEWEIRTARQSYISGGNAVLRFDSWLFIDPAILSLPPTEDGFHVIDISTLDNFVGSVDVYRVYNDITATSVTFLWQSVDSYTQDGVLLMTHPDTGQMAAIPATYDATDDEWDTNAWVTWREPDLAKIWYYSGDRSTTFASNYVTDPLSDWWAQTITMLATARLDRPLCGCNSAQDLADKYSEDLSLSITGKTYISPVQILNNPLGTRRGEVMAWRRISKMLRNRGASSALI